MLAALWSGVVARPFSSLILVLFLCNVLWHAGQGKHGSALYWLCSALLIIAVEWVIPRYG